MHHCIPHAMICVKGLFTGGKMARENNESFQIAVRVKNTEAMPYYDHLKEKAVSNPDNPHNNAGTEINILIAKDYEKSRRTKKRK